MGISWIKLDLSVRSKPEFRAILRKHGVEGGHTYWEILQYMAGQDDGIIHVKNYTYDLLADDFHVNADALKNIVDDLVLYGLISSNDDKSALWCESVLDDIDQYNTRVNKATNAAKERWKDKKKEETDQLSDDATSTCPEDMPQAYAHTSHTSHTSNRSQDIDNSDYITSQETTSQDITDYQTYDGYFDAFSMHFFNKQYEMLDDVNKRAIEQLVDKYGIGSVASKMYETVTKDRHAYEGFEVKNPIGFLTALLKDIDDDEINYPLIDDPPENIEELIGGFSSEDMESYERLLKEHDKEMLHLALLVAAENAETNLFGYTRRVLEDWRMRRITTPEKVHQEINNRKVI